MVVVIAKVKLQTNLCSLPYRSSVDCDDITTNRRTIRKKTKVGLQFYFYNYSRGGGGNLTCLWYGVVPFLGYLFHDCFRIHGHGFQQFFASSGFMGIVFCQNSFIGELFWHSRIHGYDFQKFSKFMGILLRNYSGFMGILLKTFSRFIGGTFTI